MKKITLKIVVCLFTLLVALPCFSQDYRKFEVEPGMGYLLGGGDVAGGLGFYVEPRYNINNLFSAGLYMGGAFLGLKNGDKVEPGILGSYLITGDYNVNLKGDFFRPFAGLGLGLYTMPQIAINISNAKLPDIESQTSFGLMPRVGFELANTVRFTLGYNLIFSKQTRSVSVRY